MKVQAVATDVYSYGVVSSSTLYSIESAFPEAEGYGEIKAVHHMTGGEATNSSIVLSRLGVRVKLDGNCLGDDEAGRRTKNILDKFLIDTTRLPLIAQCRSVEELVVAAPGTRTIFGTYVKLHEEKRWNSPVEDDVLEAKVVCLDPFFEEASRTVARIARAAGIPVVTVDCHHADPVTGNAGAVVLSESYLQREYPGSHLEDVFRQYQEAAPGLVVFTFGSEPVWYGRAGSERKIFEPYAVEATDTSGAGDSFRAGVVYGFLNDWDDDRTIAFSAATAALICTQSPGVQQAPGYEDVVTFMQETDRDR